MPIYEYECPVCGHFETIQKASDKPLKAKPGCDQSNCPKKAKRLVSASSFHLKGSGWYKTDYASGGKSGKSGPVEKSSESSTSSADSTTPPKASGGCGAGCGCHGGKPKA